MRRNKSFWGQWFLALKMFDHADILIPIAGFVMSFMWLFAALGVGTKLYHTLAEPAVIQGSTMLPMSDVRQYISAIDDVESMTTLSETGATLHWQDYTGPVSVYGVEEEYLRWMAENGLSSDIPFSDGMAYGVLSESAAVSLKKDRSAIVNDPVKKNERPNPLILGENDLLQSFSLDDKEIRLFALVEDIDEETLQPEEKVGIPSGVYLSDGWYETLFQSEGSIDDTKAFMINIKHGYVVAQVEEKLMAAGVSVTDEISKVMDEQEEELQKRLYSGLIALIASICVFIYQGRLWDEKHRYFIEDIGRFYQNKKAFRSIKRKKACITIVIGIVLGALISVWMK